MISTNRSHLWKTALTGLLIGGAALQTLAYPPALPHKIYGMVRGEDGEPVSSSAELIFKTDTGVSVIGNVVQNLEPGVNYRLTIPMDAGVTPVPYVENALSPLVPFRISVVIGSTTNLPIEMSGDYIQLGQFGESTRIDLTLGVDSDGDGMPDAWEEFVIALLGNDLTLADITRSGDNDGDGMSNYDEYIAGTYAFDRSDVFELHLKERQLDTTVFQFLAISGRSYMIQRSENMTDWESVGFSVPAVSSQPVSSYSASAVHTVEVNVISTNEAAYFRGVVQ